MSRDAVIVDAVRTPVGRHGGALASVRPDDLAAMAIRALVGRTGVDPAVIDDVILGCTNGAGEDNRNVARMAGLLAGFPAAVPAVTLNRLCASGLAAVNAAARAIKAGTVWVNTYNLYDSAAPFGGYKASGFGRDLGREALDGYLETKTVWVGL